MEKIYRDFINDIYNNVNLADLGDENYKIKLHDVSFLKECFLLAPDISIGGFILVKNQEKAIENAVNSALEICDKVIVFDTGSSDDTKNVVLNMNKSNVTIKDLEWIEDFAYMRNKASSYLDTDWIFFIDSDEHLVSEVSAKRIKEILSFLENYSISQDIVLSFKQESAGMLAFGYPQRLYKNHSNLQFFGFVHEELRAPNQVELRTNFTIFNSGTSLSEQRKFDKVQRYNRMLLKNIEHEPDNLKWISLIDKDFGLEYNESWYLSKLSEQIDNLKKSPNVNSFSNGFEINLLITYINILVTRQYNLEEAKEIIQFAKKYYPTTTLFYFYGYLLEITDIKEEISELINSLRKDVQTIFKLSSKDDWNQPPANEFLEAVMVLLLMMDGKYDIAKELFLKNKDRYRELDILEPEFKLFTEEK